MSFKKLIDNRIDNPTNNGKTVPGLGCLLVAAGAAGIIVLLLLTGCGSTKQTNKKEKNNQPIVRYALKQFGTIPPDTIVINVEKERLLFSASDSAFIKRYVGDAFKIKQI